MAEIDVDGIAAMLGTILAELAELRTEVQQLTELAERQRHGGETGLAGNAAPHLAAAPAADWEIPDGWNLAQSGRSATQVQPSGRLAVLTPSGQGTWKASIAPDVDGGEWESLGWHRTQAEALAAVAEWSQASGDLPFE